MTEFSKVLVECREAAGFKTAHEFYKKSGGARVLRLSFVSYWEMEKGKFLPKADRVIVLASCLRLPTDEGRVERLVRSYLRTMLGSERAYEWMIGRFTAKAPAPPATVRDQAVRRAMASINLQISLKQFEAIARDYPAYWSYVLLCNDQRAWKVADLARRLGVGLGPLKKSLNSLAKEKIVELRGDGAVRSTSPGRHSRLPRHDVTSPQDRERVAEYQAKMLSSGERIWNVYTLLRAYEPEFESFFPQLNETIGSSTMYALSGAPGEEKPGPTSLFWVEANVHRLFSF